MKKTILLFLVIGLTMTITESFSQRNTKKKSKTESLEEKDPLDELSVSALKFRCVGPALTSGLDLRENF